MCPVDVEVARVAAGETDEAARLDELHRLAEPEGSHPQEIDDIVARAAEVAGVLMATVNLIDRERQFPVASAGFEGSSVPRRDAICNVTLQRGHFVHVPDARRDAELAHSPWVDGRRGEVRFYAAAPLRTSRGYAIGTLCVFDIVPHELSQGQIDELERLAAEVVAAFERGVPGPAAAVGP